MINHTSCDRTPTHEPPVWPLCPCGIAARQPRPEQRFVLAGFVAEEEVRSGVGNRTTQTVQEFRDRPQLDRKGSRDLDSPGTGFGIVSGFVAGEVCCGGAHDRYIAAARGRIRTRAGATRQGPRHAESSPGGRRHSSWPDGSNARSLPHYGRGQLGLSAGAARSAVTRTTRRRMRPPGGSGSLRPECNEAGRHLRNHQRATLAQPPGNTTAAGTTDAPRG
jgi:hypothetical protein